MSSILVDDGHSTRRESSSSTPTPASSQLSNVFAALRPRHPNIAEQLEGIRLIVRDLPEAGRVEDIPRIRWNSKEYVVERLLHKKGRSGRYSWVAQHGIYLTEVNTMQEALKSFWSCNECDKRQKTKLLDASSTGIIRNHLENHQIYQPGSKRAAEKMNNIDQAFKRHKGEPRKAIAETRFQRFKKLIVRWIVDANVPMTAMENESLRELFDISSSGDDKMTEFLPSGDTVHNWIEKEFQSQKQEIKRQLQEDSLSRIHLSFDLWTSGNQLPILAVVAHYLDKRYTVRTRLIAFRCLHGSHSGENMANLLVEIVREFDITDQLGFFVIDNASSNDTCLQALLHQILPHSTAEQIQQRRIRCWGHILNLAAKAFLFGIDSDAFDLGDDPEATSDQQEQRLEEWRKFGAVGKAHNLVVFIRASPQRIGLFKRIAALEEPEIDTFLSDGKANRLGLKKDNQTRWNSTYLMIERILKMRVAVENFMALSDHQPGDKRVPAKDRLDSEDWRILAEYTSILKPFYTMTMRHQGRAKDGTHGALWEVLPSMEFILSHLEEMKTLYADPAIQDELGLDAVVALRNLPASTDPPQGDDEPAIAQNTRRRAERRPVNHQPPRQPQQPPTLPPANPHQAEPVPDLSNNVRSFIRIAINNAWEKIDKYYSISDKSPAYIASFVVHPGHNVRYMENKWKDPRQRLWIALAKERLRVFYEENYKTDNEENSLSKSPRQADAPTTSTRQDHDAFDAFLEPPDYYDNTLPTPDDLENYTSLRPEKIFDPITWWRDHESLYSTVAKMAFDLFSVPAMSAECERIFSQAKLVITTQRNSLSEATLEAILCLKHWRNYRTFYTED